MFHLLAFPQNAIEYFTVLTKEMEICQTGQGGPTEMVVESSLHLGRRISAFSQGLMLGLVLINIFINIMDDGIGQAR